MQVEKSGRNLRSMLYFLPPQYYAHAFSSRE